MTDVHVQLKPGHLETTGLAFIVYANRYHEAAKLSISDSTSSTGFDPVPYHLLCQSLELHLKSFIWLKDKVGTSKIKVRYGHNLEKLWAHAKVRGIDRYARATDLRNRVISLVGPYYRARQLSYLDLEMVFGGYKSLKSEPQAVPTLLRLTHQLGISLKQPILQAS